MMLDVLQAGYRLSGVLDGRLSRGLAWAVVEGLWAAVPYALLYALLQEALSGRVGPQSAVLSGLGMAACVLLRMLAARIGMPQVFAGAYAVMGAARLRVADHLRQVPMGWWQRQRTGDLSARLTSDLELIEGLWSHFLGLFASGLAMAGFLALFLLWLDWRLALVMLAGFPLAVCAMAWAQRVLTRAGDRMLHARSHAQAGLLEYVQGMAALRGFGRMGQAYARLQAVLDAQHAAMLAAEARPAPWLLAYGFVLDAGYVGLLLVGAWRIAQGHLAPGVFLGFLVLALPLYRQLFDVGLAVMLLRFARRALLRIEALLAEPPMPEPASPKTLVGHDIVLDAVTFGYSGGRAHPALADVSCIIRPHALTAVVGPSGAGKSTLLHLLARLWDVDAGSIRIGGVDVREMGTQGVQTQVAMVFQQVELFSGTVLENLRLGRPDASREAVMAAARQAQAHDFIMALPHGYDTPLAEGGASLSGGERQRLSIARALLKNAPILLLDEATASVDPSAEASIQQAMTALARGRTVVAVTHHLHSIRHADQILVLENGRLAEQGRHAQLLAQGGVYARLWAQQQAARAWQLCRQPLRDQAAQTEPTD